MAAEESESLAEPSEVSRGLELRVGLGSWALWEDPLRSSPWE